jgi:hypothetical protein
MNNFPHHPDGQFKAQYFAWNRIQILGVVMDLFAGAAITGVGDK